MNWHMFKRDDPKTWPEIDCPMLICTDNELLITCLWDNALKCFYNDEIGFTEYWECFYSYIGYLPYIEKELHPTKCKDNRYLCSHYDDGYCLGEDTKCKGIEVVTEYSIGHKRIWKEFGED